MSQKKHERYDRELKRSAVWRMAAGENVSALARELGVRRVLLYRWRDQYQALGDLAFRGKPGPRTGEEAAAIAAAREARSDQIPEKTVAGSSLIQAQQRIAELERKIGQQQLDLDFFKSALRHVKASRQANDALGETVPSRRSKR